MRHITVQLNFQEVGKPLKSKRHGTTKEWQNSVRKRRTMSERFKILIPKKIRVPFDRPLRTIQQKGNYL